MLRLKQLNIEGFGPFAARQVLDFPQDPGVTVIYGENMRGKTMLLNAIRYAFFGDVLGRASRARRLHTISNRELASSGRYGFSVALAFDYNDQVYDIVREFQPRQGIRTPSCDDDYEEDVMVRRGTNVLGPEEKERILQQIFPKDISRFFLFDGELLQEYEELLINESDAGVRISEAIERILGVPILKRGRLHLNKLADDADRLAAKEASKGTNTESLGNALQQAMEQKDAHQKELKRLMNRLEEYQANKVEMEQMLQSKQKYATLLEARDRANENLNKAVADEGMTSSELQKAMSDAWRWILREPVLQARALAQQEVQKEFKLLLMSLRAQAVNTGHCGTCDQDIATAALPRLKATLPKDLSVAEGLIGDIPVAMRQSVELNKFKEGTTDAGAVHYLWKRLNELKRDQLELRDRISDLETQLSNADPEALRRLKGSYTEMIEKIAADKRAIDEENKKIDDKAQNIERIKHKLKAIGTSDFRAYQRRAKILRDAEEVFGLAVERYKSDLRGRVEVTATQLFRSMTTEKEDYAGLAINESYGLTIRHRDGRVEEARSAGAEHIVALALMGALQNNAPLRGPIVMDSPFGRLDERHTANVIQTLPKMAEQVVLLVYEAEVGKDQVRKLLGKHLRREYELERVSARRTNIRIVK